MSPEVVFMRLRLASELRDLCVELGKSKKAKNSSSNPETSKENRSLTAEATRAKDTA